MIRCPTCNVIYRNDVSNIRDKCVLCGTDLSKEKKREIRKEENKKELYDWIKKNEEKKEIVRQKQIEAEHRKREESFARLKCSKCHSRNLEAIDRNGLSVIYAKCNDCGNFDTRKYYDNVNGKFGPLVKCDICGSTTTYISPGTGLPDWIYTDFEYVKNKTLCQKCDFKYHDEFQEKDDEIHNRHLVIEYMFDDDELKYWEEGNAWDYDDNVVCDTYNYGYKKAYEKALKEMKSKYPKGTKFVNVDE